MLGKVAGGARGRVGVGTGWKMVEVCDRTRVWGGGWGRVRKVRKRLEGGREGLGNG